MPVQGSGERIPYPADVYSLRRAGEATAPARGKNRAMTGGSSSRCLPEGRRSGDGGGAGTESETQETYRMRSNRRGDASAKGFPR